MRTVAIYTAVIIAALTGNASAQIEPSSVKASFRLTQTITCDSMDNCDGSGKISFTGSETFELPSSATDQFGLTTQINAGGMFLGSQSFELGNDPNYQVGDESVNITKQLTGPTEDITITLKMSWKNGVCKVAMKAKGTIASLVTALPSKSAALEPGNPANTGSFTVTIMNGMTVLAEAEGFFATQVQQAVSQKPLPNNGVSTKVKISYKSKYQVGEPLIMLSKQ